MTTTQVPTAVRTNLDVLHVGGPTALLGYGGVRLLTDPTFDEPGTYPIPGGSLVKLRGPALRPVDLGAVDAVLLSHDHHADNLDRDGRALLGDVLAQGVPVLSTSVASERIAGVTALAPGESVAVGDVTVTAVVAEHGHGEVVQLLGPVIGFVLQRPGLAPVYVSGDNASVDVVRDVADAFPGIGAAVLFCGAARSERAPGAFTLTARDAVEVAGILAEATIVPVHADSWSHFSEGPGTLAIAFAEAGLAERLRLPAAGVSLTV